MLFRLFSNKPVFAEVHLRIGFRSNTRQGYDRAFPLREKGMPVQQLQQPLNTESRIQIIHNAINWLNVEYSARYIRQGKTTYCNIYVYDLAYCLGAYIPRVWWHENYIPILLQHKKVKIKYAKTVFEQNSNALADWFEKYGGYYCWKQAYDVHELQNAVNKGALGIIVAQRVDLQTSGHITAVVPEKDPFFAERVNGLVSSPLQSYAGEQNKKYSTDKWWNDTEKFKKVGFWWWDI